MKKALVTGANGFIGSALVRELVANDIEVIALDRENCRSNIPEGVHFVPFDLCNSRKLTEVISNDNIDVFYHFAWSDSYGSKRGDPYTQLNNAIWAINCLCVAEEIGCSKFVGVGSLMEDEAVASAYVQGNTPGAACVYGAGKLASHSMAMYMAQQMKMDVVWTRITNAYGIGEISPRFINSTLRKIINNEPLQFTSASQNYDFIYIDDVARAFRMIGEKGISGRSYLIGSSSPRTLKEYILEIKKTLAPDREFSFGAVPFTGVNTPMSGLDCSLTTQDTGFTAKISFDEGIKMTMEWLSERL